MLKIGIDARQALKERRGIGTCVLKLINYLSEFDQKNQYILYVDREDINNLFPKKNNFIVKVLFPSNYILWEQISLPIQLAKDKVDILHLAGMTGPLIFPKQTLLIGTIYDVTYLKDYKFLPPSSIFYQKVGRIYRKYIVSLLMKKFNSILTISEFSKKDILAHFPFFDQQKIIVTHLAANEDFKIIDRDFVKQNIKIKYNISKQYILILGGIDPRKNTEFVIKNYIEMRDKKLTTSQLVIVGIPNWQKTKFYTIAFSSKYARDIIFTDHISDEDLLALYNGADIFLYPSLFEGFGLPVLEAMACGTPVIASNTSCIPEVAGDAAMLINPYDGNDLQNAIVKIQSDNILRAQLIEKGLDRVKQFSWKKMAEQTLALYEKIGKDLKK